MIEVKDLSKHFKIRKSGMLGKLGIVKACDKISFSIPSSRTLGIVGESGSGKTTAARSMLRLIEPDGGEIYVDDASVHNMKRADLRIFRKNMQIVFQDPYSSLNPRKTIEKILSEPYRVHTALSTKEIKEHIYELIAFVGLGQDQLNRYPHEFSGGQRQRIGIARAIALRPKFIILDEPVSALDVSIQGQILNLLKDLQNKLQLTYMFVAHDLAVVEHVSDFIAVMYLGKIVERNTKEGLYKKPLHPYTRSLLSSIPDLAVKKHGFSVLKGEIPSPENPPKGCHFHPRCPHVMKCCKEAYPDMKTVDGAQVACYLYEK